MLRVVFLLIIGLSTFLSGCNQPKKTEKNIKFNSFEFKNGIAKWYYKNGNLMKLQEYKDDSIENGTYLFYYPNGVLEDSSQLSNGKFHGRRYLYFKNGVLQKITTYINDKYRHSVTYRIDGSLEYYRAYNYNSNLMFIIQYDRFGKNIKKEGSPIYSWLIDDTIMKNKEFNIELLVANPPNCLTKVTICDWNIEHNKAISKTIYTPDQYNRVSYCRKQNPSSNICILNTVDILDTIGNWVTTYSVYITIDKKGVTSYFESKK